MDLTAQFDKSSFLLACLFYHLTFFELRMLRVELERLKFDLIIRALWENGVVVDNYSWFNLVNSNSVFFFVAIFHMNFVIRMSQ